MMTDDALSGEHADISGLPKALDAARQAASDGSAAVVPATGDPVALRQQMAQQRADAERARRALQHAADANERELRALLAAHQAEVAAVMGPLREQLARLEEGLWTASLYLGRDEQIEMLADGPPAPAGTPIVLRQLVLAMDQECAVAAETGGLDARSVDRFADWLLEDPAHLEQVLPDEKGIVVLVPSRQERDYGDHLLNKVMADANATSHWLIRNGGTLYMMTTNLKVGDRLLPKQSEFLDFFYQDRAPFGGGAGERVPLEPGSDAWLKAERAADARRRHYMRIMLVLQGLADRTAVLHPLPEGGVSFLDVRSQEAGKVRIINELDNVLETGREPFTVWQRRLMQQVRPGMRIIGAFRGSDWYAADDRATKRSWGHSRLSPNTASYPDSAAIHTVDRRRGDELTFKYERSDEWWGRNDRGEYGSWPYQKRAVCTIHPTDRFVLPIDLVTVEELTTYLNARTERHEYLTLFPLLKAALKALRDEAAAEEPFRLLLAGQLAEIGNIDVADALAEVDDLIRWWKFANRWHRPLVNDPDSEAAAIRGIVKEWKARRNAAAGTPEDDARAVTAFRDRVDGVICVARRRDGRYAVYTPAAEGERVWLTVRLFRKTLARDETREWTMVSGRTLASQRVLWSTPEWDTWDHNVSPADHLTGPERDAFLDQLHTWFAPYGKPIVIVYKPREDWDDEGRKFAVYGWKQPAISPGDNNAGAAMTRLTALWRRGTDGVAVLVQGSAHQSPSWGRYSTSDGYQPWRTARERFHTPADWTLVWSDSEQLAAVDQVKAEIAEVRKAKEARYARVRALDNRIHDGMRDAVVERAHTRFLEDHAGAEDLWPEQLKTVRLPERNTSWARGLLDWLVDENIDLTGLTVAAAVELYGQDVTVPADAAPVLLG